MLFHRTTQDARRATRGRRPAPEALEDRRVPATLAPIADQSVAAGLGLQLALAGGSEPSQTFTASSSNPEIQATVARGNFLTLMVSHTSSGGSDPAFSGTLTFQLFEDLTPLTVSRIEQLVRDGFYTSPTQPGVSGTALPNKNFHRIVPDFVAQGGSLTGNGTGSFTAPGYPFADEFNTQLVFNGLYQLAMANAGDDTNDTQFFFTYAQTRNLDFNHTIFGQLVAGQDIANQMEQVTRQSGTDTPVNPILITGATLSETNANGVLHINATQAEIGDSSTITVTATDPADSSQVTRTFKVTATANQNTQGQTINEPPFLNPTPNYVVAKNQSAIFQLTGTDVENNPLTFQVAGGTTGTSPNRTFTPVQNATATVDASGVVTVTPNQDFTGVINMLVGVRDNQTHEGRPSDLNNPDNFDTQLITLTVRNGEVVNLAPIANPGAANVASNVPSPIQLTGLTANPAQAAQTLTFTLLAQPAHGTVSDFNPSTGTFTYTPQPGFQGTDQIQFFVTDQGGPGPSLSSQSATFTINVGGVATGAVRFLDGVLIVQAPQRFDNQPNEIRVERVGNTIRVTVNGVFDAEQPDIADVGLLVVNGSTSNDHLVVDSDVDVPATLNGGRGGTNRLQAGGGSTRLHGWFGQNSLIGGTESNQMVGRLRHFRAVSKGGADSVFAGQGKLSRYKSFTSYPSSRYKVRPPGPPSGTFFRFQNGHLVPIPTPKLALKRLDITRVGTNTRPRVSA
jgi:cyclophilin family peptidyl-prolyl cis-trans isomerase